MNDKTRQKLEVGLGFFVTGWLIGGLVCAAFVELKLGHWIELFNGATWPTIFSPVPDPEGVLGQSNKGPEYGFWFFVVLAFRTTINLGAVLTAAFALCWILSGGLERWFVNQYQNAVRKMHDTQLTAQLIVVLAEEGITVSEHLEERLYEVAEKFQESQASKRNRELESVDRGR